MKWYSVTVVYSLGQLGKEYSEVHYVKYYEVSKGLLTLEYTSVPYKAICIPLDKIFCYHIEEVTEH